MAQRTEKEETEFKVVPETLTLCVNNCGVVGNPATNNMCQKCFSATSSSSATAAVVLPQRAGSISRSLRATSPRHVLVDRTVVAVDEDDGEDDDGGGGEEGGESVLRLSETRRRRRRRRSVKEEEKMEGRRSYIPENVFSIPS